MPNRRCHRELGPQGACTARMAGAVMRMDGSSRCAGGVDSDDEVDDSGAGADYPKHQTEDHLPSDPSTTDTVPPPAPASAAAPAYHDDPTLFSTAAASTLRPVSVPPVSSDQLIARVRSTQQHLSDRLQSEIRHVKSQMRALNRDAAMSIGLVSPGDPLGSIGSMAPPADLGSVSMGGTAEDQASVPEQARESPTTTTTQDAQSVPTGPVAADQASEHNNARAPSTTTRLDKTRELDSRDSLLHLSGETALKPGLNVSASVLGDGRTQAIHSRLGRSTHVGQRNANRPHSFQAAPSASLRAPDIAYGDVKVYATVPQRWSPPKRASSPQVRRHPMVVSPRTPPRTPPGRQNPPEWPPGGW